MKITTIRFRCLKSHAIGYGHDAIEAEAAVEPGEAPEAAMSSLKMWVLGELDAEARLRQAERNYDHLSGQIERLTNERDQLRAMVDEGRKVIRDHGKIAELARANGYEKEADLLDDELPF